MDARQIPEFTHHARKRIRQRGVAVSVAEFLLEHGDIYRHAGDGAVSVSMSQDAATMLLAEGADVESVSRARKLAAVLGVHGLVTVLRPTGRNGRRYRRQYATLARRMA